MTFQIDYSQRMPGHFTYTALAVDKKGRRTAVYTTENKEAMIAWVRATLPNSPTYHRHQHNETD